MAYDFELPYNITSHKLHLIHFIHFQIHSPLPCRTLRHSNVIYLHCSFTRPFLSVAFIDHSLTNSFVYLPTFHSPTFIHFLHTNISTSEQICCVAGHFSFTPSSLLRHRFWHFKNITRPIEPRIACSLRPLNDRAILAVCVDHRSLRRRYWSLRVEPIDDLSVLLVNDRSFHLHGGT